MAFSGGTFSRTFDCTTDRDNGVKILASKFDTELDGMAVGLSTAILKDGTQTCTAAIPFAQGITLPDDKTIAFGTNSDVLIQYDETTTDSLKISAAEGAGLAITLMADEGDDAGDEWKLNIADGGTLTLGNDINSAGTYVTHLTITPNATVANSTMAVAGNLTVGGALTLGSGAVISEAELETIDGITPGTVLASKAMVVDSDKDITGGRNLTITGELDAATLDISGNADIDGTLETDALSIDGTAITTTAAEINLIDGGTARGTTAVASGDGILINDAGTMRMTNVDTVSTYFAGHSVGGSNIVTTGALNSGSITSGFGSIDNGSSAITTTGTVTAGDLTVDTTTLKVDSTNNRVGIGTASPARQLTIENTIANSGGEVGILSSDSSTSGTFGTLHFGNNTDTSLASIRAKADGSTTAGKLEFNTEPNGGAIETRMTIDSSGNLLVAKTALDYNSVAGHIFRADGLLSSVRDGGNCANFNRLSSDGEIIQLGRSTSSIGSIGAISGDLYICSRASSHSGLHFGALQILPTNNAGADSDNSTDLGDPGVRFDDIFATNGTIQTSDENEKQNIASLTSAEITAAKAISKLFKTFKWKDKVAAKSDAARTHAGVIAQEVQTAMSDAGLDASKYAFWCSDTWYETSTEVAAVEAVEEVLDDDGNVTTEAVEAKDAYTRIDKYQTADEAPKGATQRTRLGVRYPELLAFIGAATEQRLDNIETRLAALEAG